MESCDWTQSCSTGTSLCRNQATAQGFKGICVSTLFTWHLFLLGVFPTSFLFLQFHGSELCTSLYRVFWPLNHIRTGVSCRSHFHMVACMIFLVQSRVQSWDRAAINTALHTCGTPTQVIPQLCVDMNTISLALLLYFYLSQTNRNLLFQRVL